MYVVFNLRILLLVALLGFLSYPQNDSHIATSKARLQLQTLEHRSTRLLTTTQDHQKVLFLHRGRHFQLWDGATGRLIWERDAGNIRYTSQARFFNKDKYLVTLSHIRHDQIHLDLWDTATGRMLQSEVVPGHQTCHYSMAFFPNGDVMTSCFGPRANHVYTTDLTIWAWNGVGFNRPETKQFGLSWMRSRFSAHPSGKRILVDSRGQWTWPELDISCVLVSRTSNNGTMAHYSTDGRFIAAGGYHTSVWDADTCTLLFEAKGTEAIFDATTEHLITRDNTTLRRYSLPEGKLLSTQEVIPNKNNGVYASLLPGPDSGTVYVTSNQRDTPVQLIDTIDHTIRSSIESAFTSIKDAKFHQTKDTVALALKSEVVLLWDLTQTQAEIRLTATDPRPITRDIASYLSKPWPKVTQCEAMARAHKTLDIRETANTNDQDNDNVVIVDHFIGKHRNNTPIKCDVSPDKRYFAAPQTGSSFKIWGLQTGKLAAHIKTQTSLPRAALFSPSGRFMITHEGQSQMNVWEVGTWTLLYNVAFAPNGDYIAWTPEGRFKATPGRASDFAHVVRGNRVITDPNALKPFETHDLLNETEPHQPVSDDHRKRKAR